MGFVVQRPSRMQGQHFFGSWVGQATCFGRVQKILWRATQSGYDISKAREGCLTSTYVNFFKITKLIVMGWQPMMHPLASIRGMLFMTNSLCIIALSMRLDYTYLELLKLGICENLETRSRWCKVVSKVVHLIHEDKWTPTNENTWVPRIPNRLLQGISVHTIRKGEAFIFL